VDFFILAVAFALAYLLRFDFAIPEVNLAFGLQQLPLVLGIQWAALVASGAYSFVWRYVGMAEITTFLRAGVISAGVLLALRLGTPENLIALRVPLSVIVIDAVLASVGVVGIRVGRRALAEHLDRRRRSRGAGPGGRPAVLLIGAGAVGVMAAHEIRSRGELELDVRGFVDDDPLKRDAVIAGVRVLGSCDDLSRLVPEHAIDHVILTIADASAGQARRILDICRAVPVRVQTIPAFYDILQGKVEISRFRDVRAEELLERDPVRLDESDLVSFLGGRTVMVTGAGGSIGAELARQVARIGPSCLLLVDRAEFALFHIQRELKELWPELDLVPLVADVADRSRMDAIFSEHRPQVVAHAAAHKHVPLMEANAVEAVRNNIFATRSLGELAGRHGVETFVMISTDKAVRPSSIMGASKRVAELVVQDLGRTFSTRFVAVRFGNVLGSSGSVIPILREQIARGGPVTITHPEMKRYFMTIPEAAVLVLHAGAMGKGGEIFVLDMGEPVRILDLARRLMELSGRDDQGEIDIVFTGVRPGEKLFEELETSDEAIAKTRHPKIYIGKIAGRSSEELAEFLGRLDAACREGAGASKLRSLLGHFLPESELLEQQAEAPAPAQQAAGDHPDAPPV
jgi:FlaA1/EpsC-like NDP-sugar epimerase